MPTALSIVLEQIISKSLPNQELMITEPISSAENINEVFDQIAFALQSNHTLKAFTIIDCISETTQAFCEALKNYPSLDQVHIVQETYYSASSMEELENNLKRTIEAREKILDFLNCLTVRTNIKCLILKCYYADNDFLNQLSAILRQNKSLETIYIRASALNYDEKTLINFTNALKSKSLKNLKIVTQSPGNKSIASLLTNNTQPLEKLSLNCGLTVDIIPYLNTFLVGNKTLKQLSLEDLRFTIAGIQQLTPESLKNLHTLKLKRCGIRGEILGHLINNIVIHLGSLNELDLSFNAFTVEDIDSIDHLIKNNQNLKILRTGCVKSQNYQLLKLKETLRNPQLCQLKSFRFLYDTQNKQNIELIVDILRNNPNLIEFGSYSPNIDVPDIKVEAALQINKMKNNQDQFINAAITLVQGFNDNQTLVSILPTPIILKILLKIAKPGLVGIGVKLRTELILKNLKTRKKLIEKQEYTSERDNSSRWFQTGKDISSWWCAQAIYRNKRLTLFSPRKKLSGNWEMEDAEVPYFVDSTHSTSIF